MDRLAAILLAMFEMLADEMQSLVGDVFVTAAAFEPMHVWFAAEPGELTLGVVAMALLGLSHSLFAGEYVLQYCGGFGVAE